jgi:hypothetical protein
MDLKKKIYISITIFGIAAVLLVAFLIYPLFQSINKNSEALLSQKGKLALLKKEVESTQGILSLYEDYQPNLEKLDALFVDPGNPIEFINFLEDNAKASQIVVEISSLQSNITSLSQSKGAKIWSSLDFQLSLNGSFSNFSKYLDKLENSPYLIEILDFSIKKREANSAEIQNLGIGATLSLRVYAK